MSTGIQYTKINNNKMPLTPKVKSMPPTNTQNTIHSRAQLPPL